MVLNIILILAGIVVFIYLGYLLWQATYEKYNHNIFGLGVIIRGILSILLLMASMDASGENTTVLFTTAVLLWVWTFIVTLINTNILIAFFSLFYQLFAVILVKSAIEKVLKWKNGY